MLIGITAPLIGLFLVLRRLSMIGDTLSHVTIAGVALGFLIEVYPIAVGLIFAVLASFAIEKLRKAYKSYAELSIAIIMSGGVALASLFFTLGKGYNADVMSYLFGSIYTLDATDLKLVGVVTLIVVIVVALLHKEFFLLSFEEDAADGYRVACENSEHVNHCDDSTCHKHGDQDCRCASGVSTIDDSGSSQPVDGPKFQIRHYFVRGDWRNCRSPWTGCSRYLEPRTWSNDCIIADHDADSDDDWKKGFRA